MELICLTENTTENPLLTAEHGLSIYIETAGRKILLDFGQTDALLSNAKALGVDLSQVDLAVLSHGHYDHGGGLFAFLSVNSTAAVYVSQTAFGDYYNGTEKYIGLDPALQHHPQIKTIGQTTQIGEEITLLVPFDKTSVVPIRQGGLTQKQGESFLPDDFSHELYLEIKEQGKPYLFSGCAHKGIENIMAWYKPDVFVGGMHLSHFPLDATLEQIGEILKNYPARYITCHCTGITQFEFLNNQVKNISYLSCGKSMEI
ncbi:MAG: MBL fold metallo-hydrolase [Clostridia bacterium]|nr:MBL fold metallo-hydrolase [Clostridia bacterium]